MSESEPTRRVRSSYKRRRSKSKRKKLIYAIRNVSIVGAIGLVLVFFAFRILRPPETNTAEAITSSKDFDPLEEYDVILEKGNAEQKLILLNALSRQRQQGLGVPILSDLFKKIVAASNEVLDEDSLAEKDHSFAAKSNLDAIWKLYLLNIQNDVNDPFVSDQYRNAIDRFISNGDEGVAKKAHIARVRYFTGEIITQRNTNMQNIADAAKDSLQLFPDDMEVVDGIRRAHSQLIVFNQDHARVLADAVIANQSGNDSKQFQALVQQLNDLTLLYEKRIGNLPSITAINTSLDDFCKRLMELAGNTQVGETIYRQLFNGIDYLERQQHFDRALELGKLISQTAVNNPNPKYAKMGKEIGDRCVKRNSIVNSAWQFEETDFRGRGIEPENFDGAVTLVVMYETGIGSTAAFLKTMESLERAFQGRNLRIIYNAVSGTQPQGNPDLSVGQRNVLLVTSKTEPNKYLLQCPASRLPYLVLIDKEGKIRSINVPLKALKTRVEALL